MDFIMSFSIDSVSNLFSISREILLTVGKFFNQFEFWKKIVLAAQFE